MRKLSPTRHVGEPSSKYGYDPRGELFERDMKAHLDRCDWLWTEFVDFMKTHDVNPAELRWMFTEYYEQFLK